MNATTTVYLVRHGQTEWNIERRFQGHQDSPLTDMGVKQATWLADALRDERIDAVYSSSSPRARRTADIVKGDRALAVREADELKEINLGVWEGMRQEEAERADPGAFRHFWDDPSEFRVEGSETFDETAARSIGQLERILSEHPGQTVLIVTHTVVVKLLMAHFEGRSLQDLWKPPYIHPACLCKIEVAGRQSEIVLHGDIRHYREEAEES
ncbi:histidine phosphatase family protein [Cohnella zeiphila]|uniref:Histidine phosphatase family protein n=1 Tax=Cohnella zeiphila TaxID=2761120 RepID=A0A7X0SS96_9BACL|nr:histidine phosphatase family protein [Cohnella zeiphila]MBB6735154.1 histidine phosphatase family protein [Cohnella zeiphila]